MDVWGQNMVTCYLKINAKQFKHFPFKNLEDLF
jgi:hypothetical protein